MDPENVYNSNTPMDLPPIFLDTSNTTANRYSYNHASSSGQPLNPSEYQHLNALYPNAIITDFGICVGMKNCTMNEKLLYKNYDKILRKETPMTLPWLSRWQHDTHADAMNKFNNFVKWNVNLMKNLTEQNPYPEPFKQSSSNKQLKAIDYDMYPQSQLVQDSTRFFGNCQQTSGIETENLTVQNCGFEEDSLVGGSDENNSRSPFNPGARESPFQVAPKKKWMQHYYLNKGNLRRKKKRLLPQDYYS